MKHSTGAPTKAQQARFDALQEIGCICCWNWLGVRVGAEIHHIVSGFKRHGHDETVPLCAWHRRGVYAQGVSRREMTDTLGASLANGKRSFVRDHGTEAQLLETVNAMIARRAA